MRILLLIRLGGGGHKRAAQAMEVYFREHLPGARCAWRTRSGMWGAR